MSPNSDSVQIVLWCSLIALLVTLWCNSRIWEILHRWSGEDPRKDFNTEETIVEIAILILVSYICYWFSMLYVHIISIGFDDPEAGLLLEELLRLLFYGHARFLYTYMWWLILMCAVLEFMETVTDKEDVVRYNYIFVELVVLCSIVALYTVV